MNVKYWRKQEKFAPYIPIAKARGFTALSGKNSVKLAMTLCHHKSSQQKAISYIYICGIILRGFKRDESEN